MNELRRWLEDLGLSSHAQAFEDNGIDLEVLPHLSERDLREIGLSLGPRRKLLAALDGLADKARGQAPARSAVVPALASPPAGVREAERRQITVMFCDLADSAALSTRLDPEELSNVLSAYRDACSTPIERYGGFIARFVGDGILAYFGYPLAHEDDVDRALLAALETVQAVRRLQSDIGHESAIGLAVRIGIATGPVVVGDLIGESQSEKDAVVGKAPNLAARLQAIAEPNTVVIDSDSRQIAAEGFAFRDLPKSSLKGFDGLLSVSQVVAARDVASRFEARSPPLVSLIGRDSEMGVLLRQWELAKTGHGRLALIRGEPGIGKSRLARSLYERIAEETPEGIAYHCFQCSAHHVNSALHPFIKQLQRAAGIGPGSSAAEQLKQLDRLVDQSLDRRDEVIALFAELLEIALPAAAPKLEMSPRQKRERTLAALDEWLRGAAGKRPLLLLIEDAQWIDPTSLELFNRIIGGLTRVRGLVVVTFRPGFQPPWLDQPQVILLTLDRLSEGESEKLVGAVIGPAALTPALVDEVLRRTDGIPLFIEEFTKSLLVLGAGESAERNGEKMAVPPLAIPSQIYGPLMSRIDQLGPAKEVAQLGAVIGREFSYRLLWETAQLSEERLASLLLRLTNSELVTKRGVAPESTYSFKHALIQEAAYESLLRRKRQRLHLHIAAALERQRDGPSRAAPELLAFHYVRAGAVREAIKNWQAAAQRALAHCAQVEAESHLRKALQSLDQLKDPGERQRVQLALKMELGAALRATRGYAASEVESSYLEARALCADVGTANQSFSVEWALMQIYLVQGKVNAASEIAERLYHYAGQDDSDALLMDANLANGMASFHMGDFERARACLERSAELHKQDDDQPRLLTHGQHPKVFALSYLSFALWFLGYPDRAVSRAEEAMAIARRISHAFSYVSALAFAIRVRVSRRDFEQVDSLSRELIEISHDNGYTYYEALAKIHLSWASVLQRRSRRGVETMLEGLDALRQTGTVLGMPGFLVQLAEAYLCLGRANAATEAMEEATSKKFAGGTRCWNSEIMRLRGEIMAPGDEEVAEDAFRTALDIAHEQKARSLQLRTSIRLAELLRAQGRPGEALGLLSRCLSTFEEGRSTVELRTASAILEELERG